MFLALVVAALIAAGQAADTDDGVLRRVSDVAAAVHDMQLGATFEINAIAMSPVQNNTNLSFVASDDSGSVLIYQEPEIALNTIQPGTRVNAVGRIVPYDKVSQTTAAALAVKLSITGEGANLPTPTVMLSDIKDGRFGLRYVRTTGIIKAVFHDTIDKNYSFAVLVGNNASRCRSAA